MIEDDRRKAGLAFNFLLAGYFKGLGGNVQQAHVNSNVQ